MTTPIPLLSSHVINLDRSQLLVCLVVWDLEEDQTHLN